MKKIGALLVLQAVLLFAYAGVFDNQKIKVDNNNFSPYIITPMPDNGYLLVSNENTIAHNVVRLDAQGQVQWAKTFYNADGYGAMDVGVFLDSTIYIIYEKAANYMAIKLTAQGAMQWTNEFDFTTEAPYQINSFARPQPDGSLIFTPSTYDKIVAIKINPNGSVATSFVITTDTTGNSKNPCLGAEPTPDGGMVIIAKNDTAPVIVRLDSAGNATWMLHYSNGFYNRPQAITHTADGNYLVGGVLKDRTQTTNLGAFLVKISAAGTVLWGKTYQALIDSAKQDSLLSFLQVRENNDSTITIAGGGNNPQSNSVAAAFMTLDASGQALSAYSYQSSPYSLDVRLYKTTDGVVKVSATEYDSISGSLLPILIDPSKLSLYCKTHAFAVSAGTLPSGISLSNSVFVHRTLAPPLHPAISTRDTALIVTGKDLCGLATAVQEIVPLNTIISIMPNPSSSTGEVTIKWQGETALSSILLHDINGRLVKQIPVAADNQVSFRMNGLQPGFYLAEFRNTLQEKLGVKKMLVVE